MIYTITFNPSLDYIVHVENFQTGEINKASYEEILPGGKGINVSIVLSNLGIENTAWGFLAGFTGIEIEERLRQMGCQTDFIHLEEGFSRINVKMKSCSETEINGMGPHIGEADLNRLFSQLNRLHAGDYLVISGSVPSSLPNHIYAQILQRLEDSDVEVIVDTTNQLLLGVLKYHPFLIKPNHHELGEIFQVTLDTPVSVIPYAKKLQELGARNVLISMAEAGAVFVGENGAVLMQDAPCGTVVNSVGAGDSMVAGFLAGWLKDHSYEQALLNGVACGSASAFHLGLAKKEDVEEIQKQFE